MTKHYNYKMNWYGKEIIISATVPDRIEERLSWKKVTAAQDMTMWVREASKGFYLVRAKDLVEVRKNETVSREDTLEAMHKAENEWRSGFAIACGGRVKEV